MVSLGQKKYFDVTPRPTPPPPPPSPSKPNNLYFTDQNRIAIGQNIFSLKVLLLYTVGKYMKNKTKFNKRPYAENELVASYETLQKF